MAGFIEDDTRAFDQHRRFVRDSPDRVQHRDFVQHAQNHGASEYPVESADA